MTSNELFYILALIRTEGIGDTFAKKLLDYFGSAENIFSASEKDFLEISRLTKTAIKGILNKSSFEITEKEIAFIEKQQLKTYFFKDDNYPSKLKHCPYSSIILYSIRNFYLNNRHVLSIVGTRQISSYGSAFCKKRIEYLSEINPII